MKITRKQTDNFKPFEITIAVENTNEQLFLQALFGAFSVNEILNNANCKFDKEYTLDNEKITIVHKLQELYRVTL